MRKSLMTFVLAAALVAPGAATAEEPEKPERPFLVYVAPASELALEPAEPPEDVTDSVEDVRKHIEKKRQDWLKLVPGLDQAEVVIELVGREQTTKHGSVLRGRYSIFTLQGDIIGQGDLSGKQIFGIWGTAASDLAGRLERMLEAFHPVLSKERDTLARPAVVLAVRHGEQLAERGDTAAALAAFERALELAPEHAAALRGHGQALVDRGDNEQAVEVLGRVIELKQADAATFFARARAHQALGHEEEADGDRRVALTAVPKHPEPGANGLSAISDDPEADPTGAVAAELAERDGKIDELQARADSYRETMKKSSSLYEKQLRELRYDRDALRAALRTCRAGDEPICGALVARARTGVADIPSPPAPPPPPPEAIDKAVVRVASANLRSGPSTSDAVVRKLKQGELLALLDREHQDGWYPIIHVASAQLGWIHGELLELELAEEQAGERPSPFRGRKVAEEGAPRVTVQNDADLTMTLTVGNERHTIPPHTSRSLDVPPGSHRYIGAAPGVLPALGTQAFERGHEYSWRFWIRQGDES